MNEKYNRAIRFWSIFGSNARVSLDIKNPKDISAALGKGNGDMEITVADPNSGVTIVRTTNGVGVTTIQ